MSGNILESLDAVLSVKLYDKGILLFSGKGTNAGLEISDNAVNMSKST